MRCWLVPLTLLLSSALHAEVVSDVRVFTTSLISVQDAQSRATATYRLDDVDRVLAELSRSLPSSYADAETVARQRLNSTTGAIAMQRLQGAFEGQVMAWSHGIDRLPAVLINDRYIIYGVRDVDEALRLFVAKVP